MGRVAKEPVIPLHSSSAVEFLGHFIPLITSALEGPSITLHSFVPSALPPLTLSLPKLGLPEAYHRRENACEGLACWSGQSTVDLQ